MNWGKLFNSKRNKRTFYVLASIVVFVTTYMLVLPALTLDQEDAAQQPGINIDGTAEETAVSQEAVNELETVADPFEIEQQREDALNDTEQLTVTDTTDSSTVDSFDTQDNNADTQEVIDNTTPEAPSQEETLSVSPDDRISAVTEGDFYLFNYESEEINVFVKAPLEAFPEGTTMKVTPLDEEEVIDSVNAALESSKKKAKSVKAVDIKFFDAEGKEVEPSTEIKVSLKSNLIKNSANTEVIHIDEEGTGKLVQQANEETAEDEVAFESKDFSPYVIAETIETEITISNENGNDETYLVKVTYGPEAKIPEGTIVVASELSPESEEYLAAYNTVVGEEKTEVGFIAFDLSLYDTDNNKAEPEAPVKVTLELKTLPEDVSADDLKASMELKHIKETEEGLIAEEVANTYSQYGEFGGNITVEEETVTATFNVDGFSTFTFTWTDNTLRENVIVHYVDISGKEISGTQTSDVNVNGNVAFSSYEGGITGYTFKEARLDNITGPVVTGFNTEANNDRLNFVNNGTNVRYVERPYNVEVFFIYEPIDYPDGGDIPDLDAPETSKTLVRQDDGTYDITLTISGTSQVDEDTKKANIVVVYDSSNSMSESQSTTSYVKDDNGMYGLVDGEYILLTNGRIWYMENQVYTGYRYKAASNNNGTQYAVYNNQLIQVYYNNGTWYRTRQGNWWNYRYSNPWTGTRYIRVANNDNDTSYNLGFDQSSGQIRQLTFVEGLIYNVSNTPYLYSGDRYAAQTTSSTRDQIAKTAVTSLANKLFALNTSENQDMVEMAFLDFGTMVNEVNGARFTINGSTLTTNADPTTNKNTFLTWLNAVVIPNTSQSINDNLGGTNWEEGLKIANLVRFKDDDPVYIIFISDGSPTYRVSQNNHTGDGSNSRTSNGRTINVYGTGNSDNSNYNLDAAVMEAKNILAANKTLYTVGAFVVTDNKLPNLGGEDFDASDSDKLMQALDDIVDSITKALNIANVQITDGLTAFTASAFVGGVVDPDSFRYTKNGQAWAPLNDGAERADVITLEDNSQTVQWNMGEDYVLEKGVPYTVTFTVWPKQEAYDLLADLNNGLVSYDELSEDIKKQIIKNGNTYTVLTNTNASATYQVVSFEDGEEVGRSDPKTTQIKNPTNGMGLDESHLDLKKEWNDSLDPSQLNSLLTRYLRRNDDGELVTDDDGNYFCDFNVVLHVMNDNHEYVPVTITPKVTVVNEKVTDSEWPVEKVFIAPGVMLSKTHALEKGIDPENYTEVTYDGTTYIVLETGHDYSIDEQYTDYHFELRADTYHPMVVDGVVCDVKFIYDGDDQIAGITAIDTDNVGTIVATNELRPGINISKTVYESDGETKVYPSEEFSLTVSFTNPDGSSVKYEDYLLEEPYPIGEIITKERVNDSYWYIEANSGGKTYSYYTLDEEGTQQINQDTYPIWYNIYYDAGKYDDVDIEYTYERSPGMIAQSGDTITIKSSDRIRFANVPIGTSFSIKEVNVPDGYEFDKYETKIGKSETVWNEIEDQDTGFAVEGVIGNQSYYLNVVNKQLLMNLQIKKIEIGSNPEKTLNGAEFDLYDSTSVDENKNLKPDAVPIRSGIKTENGGIAEINNIVAGTYYLVETKAPAGYELLEKPIEIIADSAGTKYSQSNVLGGRLQDAADISVQDSGIKTYQIVVQDSAGTELPMTGGTGTSRFYILGSMLIAGSFMYEYSLRRNRKRKEVK